MSRDLKDIVETDYFSPVSSDTIVEGSRDLNPLFPFIISGGENTERWYFKHISSITNYKFNVVPEYFGNESNYTIEFPQRINDILKKNPNAIIFCVFDLDDIIRKGQVEIEKFEKFKNDLINNNSIIICPSMPSIEYWFLLHFENYTKRLRSCGPKSKLQRLLTYYMSSFFPTSSKKIINTLKDETYVQYPTWVQNLCANGKLELATQCAEDNIKKALENNDLDNQSYSYVYLIFKNYDAR